MHGEEKSDRVVVPEKPPNKAAGTVAEGVEERTLAKGNAGEADIHRTRSRARMNRRLARVRQAARRDRKQRFTALLHHIYDVDTLAFAYWSLDRKAASGIDGVTWQSYGEDLRGNLLDLSTRLRRGSYRASAVKRVFIPKADGRQRPIGMPTLEDKIVQRALHYVLDSWAHQWRRRQARGDVIIVRYADDFVVGFQHRGEAVRFLADLRDRFAQFGLMLHPDKTRLLEFGRYAAVNRERRGVGKPETFDFLGFTHICGRTRRGRFKVLRLTMRKRMAAKLREVKALLRNRWHRPVHEVGR